MMEREFRGPVIIKTRVCPDILNMWQHGTSAETRFPWGELLVLC